MSQADHEVPETDGAAGAASGATNSTTGDDAATASDPTAGAPTSEAPAGETARERADTDDPNAAAWAAAQEALEGAKIAGGHALKAATIVAGELGKKADVWIDAAKGQAAEYTDKARRKDADDQS